MLILSYNNEICTIVSYVATYRWPHFKLLIHGVRHPLLYVAAAVIVASLPVVAAAEANTLCLDTSALEALVRMASSSLLQPHSCHFAPCAC
jgi:hypothetical protein